MKIHNLSAAEQALNKAIFYHESPIGELKELNLSIYEHGQVYVYFADSPLIALLYVVKPVSKPFSLYPYGFDNNDNVIYSEYFKDTFKKLYQGKKSFLYVCHQILNAEQFTQIKFVYICSDSVKVDKVTEIPDLYLCFKKQEQSGKFRIRAFHEISEEEMDYVVSNLKETV